MASSMSGTVMRTINEGLVLSRLGDRGAMSRTNLATDLNLTPAAISRITAHLIERRLIEQQPTERVPPATPAAGRPPTLLRLASDLAGIGVDLRAGRQVLTCSGTDGQLLFEAPLELPDKPSPADFIDIVGDAVARLRQGLPHRFTGIGLSIPGLMGASGRTVRESAQLGWQSVQIADDLEARTGLPVAARHVAECAALANARQPELRGCDRLLHIQIGLGIGMALTRSGRLDETLPLGWGGIGHALLGDPGRQCTCGRFGCLDTVVGFEAFARRAVDAGVASADDPSAMRQVARLMATEAASGTPWARESLEELLRYLARAIAVFLSIEVPDRVTLGGFVLQLGEDFLDDLAGRVSAEMLAPSPIVTTSIGDSASALGAATLGLNQVSRL